MRSRCAPSKTGLAPREPATRLCATAMADAQDSFALAVAVPTFNRSSQLAHLLEQLAVETAGLSGGVLVLVSDNQSTDNTTAVLRAYAINHPHVAFEAYVQPINIGPIPNIHFLVRTARAEWLWCLGDDDLLRTGALRRVLQALETNNTDVLLVRTSGTYEWRTISPGPTLRYVQAASNEGAAYLMAAGFLASALVRTSTWRSLIDPANAFDAPNYANWVAVILAAIRGGSVCLLDEAMVDGNATMEGDVRFSRYSVLAMQRLHIWRHLMDDPGPGPQVAAALRPHITSMFWHSWRSIAAGTDRSLPSALDRWRGFREGAHVLGWTAAAGLPWLILSLTVPLALRVRLARFLRLLLAKQ